VNRRHRVAIIGGGITGLTSAFTLKQIAERANVSLDCTVFESKGRLGGKILTHREDGFVLEAGPDSLLARKPHGMQLIRDLGIESEIIYQSSESLHTYISRNGQLQQMPAGTNMGIPVEWDDLWKSPLLTLAGKLRVRAESYIPRLPHTTSDESLGLFLRSRLGDELVNHLIEPLLAGIYAGRVNDLSLLATFPHFLKWEEQYGSLLKGAAAARKTAQINTSGRSTFVTLKGGLETLIERLYDCLQDWVTVSMRTSITNIRKQSSGNYLLDVVDASGTHVERYDTVIVTTSATAAGQLLSGICEVTNELIGIPYVSTATVQLAYAGNPLDEPWKTSGFLIPAVENRTITACTWTSSKWPHTTPHPYVVIRCYVGRDGQTEGLDLRDAELVNRVCDDIQDFTGIKTRPAFTMINRWNHAMPQYRVGHLELVQRVEQSLASDAPGVYIAGGAYYGVGIPDCIAQAQAAAHRVIEYCLR